jgi:cell division protein FtsI (penicillin-binding protein 3)
MSATTVPTRRRRPTNRSRTGFASTPPKRRLSKLAIGFALFALALVARLTVVQVLDSSSYASYAQGELDQTVTLNAARGAIYDSTGDLLAISVPRFDIISDDFLITDPGATAAALAPVLKMSQSHLKTLLGEHNGYVALARQVSQKVDNAVTALSINGISSQTDQLRVSPGGQIFQPLLGAVNASGQGYAGVEYAFNGVLGGRAGSEEIDEAPGGVRLSSAATEVTMPREGQSVVLTIDEPLQVEATKDVTAQMRAQHAASGIAVIENVHTGAILAMVDLVTGPKGAIVPAPQNLALTSIYQPGSVMKLATVGYSLQDHLISPTTPFVVPYSLNVGGYTFEDADYHPTEVLTVSQILAQSSNIGVIKISRLLGLQRLAKAFSTLGFGEFTGLNWPGESPGIIGTPATWYGSSAGSVPIGTGVAVTPMQILDAYNSVANGGVFLPPHLLAATVGADGTQTPAKTPVGHRVFDPSTVTELVPMLEGVVQDGTAVAANIPGYKVAGKTGTAQVPESNGLGYVPGDFNGTFVGFVPAQAPELSGIVVLNHPNTIYGGTVAAPVFAEIMQYALRHFDIAPVGTATSASTATSTAAVQQ